MDKDLLDLMERAAARGNNYLKGETVLEDLPENLAELGVYLLERAKVIPDLRNDKLKEEFIEIQGKLDDLRKVIFAGKLQVR